MKRTILFIIAVLFLLNSKAQDITDGLRYSLDDLKGTARFTALSGAFGALGGDLSAMSINPAGSAIFLNNFSSATFSVSDVKNNAVYFNTNAGSSDTDINIDQAGVVLVFVNSNTESAWKKFSMGINYNSSRNYDNELSVIGKGYTSIADFFVQQAQGIPLYQLELRSGETISELYRYLGETQGTAAQNAFLGYQGYLFDPVIPGGANTQYVSNIAPGRFNQNYYLVSKGFKGKYSFNIATQITDRFYIGLNFNTYSIDYHQGTYLYETNYNPGSLVNKVGFENNLFVYGNGFSTQIGGILKLTESFRIGLTYDSPTWLNIYEETSQVLESQRTVDGMKINELINPKVVNVYEKYELRTPGQLLASAAYIFGKHGLISFDYSYRDYSTIKFGPSWDPYFTGLNQNIKEHLNASSSYRIGAEYRIKRYRLRGGYLFEESPYKDKDIMDDLSGYSLGTGIQLGDYGFDFTFSRSQRDRSHQLYSIGLTDSALIETSQNNYILSINYNL
jgi:hypothetical protein